METERPKDRLGVKVIKIGICQPGSGTGRRRRRRRRVVRVVGVEEERGLGVGGVSRPEFQKKLKLIVFPHKTIKERWWLKHYTATRNGRRRCFILGYRKGTTRAPLEHHYGTTGYHSLIV